MMAVKKTQPNEWIPVIQALFKEIIIGAIALMSAYSLYIAKQSSETVDRIEHSTDGSLTAAKLAVAISAETLAESTKKPEHVKMAEEARSAYNARVVNEKDGEKH